MPETVLCEKCGGSAGVVTDEVDKEAMGGEMAASDRRWEDGFFYTIDCPNCGTRMQCLAPLP
jgi:hypothetical protein